MSHAPLMSGQKLDLHWSSYAASPVDLRGSTSIAVNLGGTVIPVVMSVFLSTLVSLVDVLIGVLIVTILIHKIARPVKGVGIAIHELLPPFLAVETALIISPNNAPLIAYISGTLGCLIGIDILNPNSA